jgi:Fe-S cluster assembly protein SufD
MVETLEREAMNQADVYVEQFGRFETEAKQPSWLFPLRKAGMARFAELGFPTTKDEDWRFTNVSPIAKLPFRPVLQPAAPGVSADRIAQSVFGSLPARRLVFINGHFAPSLSSPGPRLPGVRVMNLAAALAEDPAFLEQHLGRYVQTEKNSFAALNAAFFQDGGFIHVGKGVSVEEPIHLVYVSALKEPGAASNPRNLIIAEEGSHVTVLETHFSTVESPQFSNVVTELMAGDGASVEHLKFQDENLAAYHIASIHAQFGRNSNTILHSIATGAKLSRNSIHAHLAGEGLECVLNGLYLTRGDQLADHHMVVEHAQPHCASHEYYNGILDGRSKGVFHGRILVRQAAQKTDAKQTNKNLLLSDDATIDTKPQLEIYADDVKCTHGATVGQLNEESIFYLRTRGIGTDTARRMLIHSFAGEIIERIRFRTARDEMDRLVWDRLEANPHVGETK